MTILERNSSRLVIQARPIWQGLWFVSICWFLGLALAFSAQATNLSCHRIESHEGSCELTTTALSGSSTQQISLDQIKTAAAAPFTTTDSRGRQITDYHILLQTNLGSVTVVERTNWNETDVWIDRINTFLTNATQRELSLNRGSLWVNYAVSLALCGFGLYLAAFILQVGTYSFNKTAGTLVIEKQLLYKWSKEYPLSDIRDLEIHYQETRRNDRVPIGRLYFELKSLKLIATNLPGDSESDRFNSHVFGHK